MAIHIYFNQMVIKLIDDKLCVDVNAYEQLINPYFKKKFIAFLEKEKDGQSKS